MPDFDDDQSFPPTPDTIEIARVVLGLVGLTRNDFSDGHLGCVEVYNTEPANTSQLKQALDFVKHRLCAMCLGDELGHPTLELSDFKLEYVHYTTEQADGKAVEMGFRLTVQPRSIPLSQVEIDWLRKGARDAALVLRDGEQFDPPELDDDPFPVTPRKSRGPGAIAARLRTRLKGRSIHRPFTFSATSAPSIEFEGRFAGDEEINAELDPVWLRGYINSVVYRGQVLSFELDVVDCIAVGPAKQHTIEFSPAHRADVHRLAGDPDLPVWLNVEVRESRRETGQIRTTYTLVSVERASDLWEDCAEEAGDAPPLNIVAGEPAHAEW